MKDIWNQRYSSEEFAYGKDPNNFFSSQLENKSPGKILLPGEGEGRNAVHAAMKAWSVDAFDQSDTGRDKALAFASEKGVRLHYEVCQAADFHFRPGFYDFAALIYFHADPAVRKRLHRNVYESLKPDGTLILEAFHKEQLQYNTGGPKSEELLYDKEILLSDFAPLEIQNIEKRKIILNEGPFHQGEALVIRLVGKKPHSHVKQQ